AIKVMIFENSLHLRSADFTEDLPAAGRSSANSTLTGFRCYSRTASEPISKRPISMMSALIRPLFEPARAFPHADRSGSNFNPQNTGMYFRG
ncbi:MAG: hypothetical protein J7L16_09325, partial [Deltaproteobacteria bacterium]|nr:hypothetical protein [Deltaproteobacteria bacterium]